MKSNFFPLQQILSLNLILAILLFPFQKYGLQISNSLYDLTSFLIFFYLLLILININKITIYLIIFSFLIFQLLLNIYLDITPLYRLFSGMVWFGGLFTLFLLSKYINISYKNCFISIIFTMFISGIYYLIQLYLNPLSLPSAWFQEASPAGLCFLSVSIGFLGILIFCKQSKLTYLITFALMLFFLFLGIKTKSTGIAPFILIALILLFKNIKYSYKYIIYFLLILSFIFFLEIHYFIDFNHYSDRIFALSDPKSNLSMLVWFRGIDQMLTSFGVSPFFGLGLGSTGFFHFDSDYSFELGQLGLEELNIKDSYSLFFRMIIEMGAPFTLLFIIYLFSSASRLNNYLNIYSYNSNKYYLFCKLFSFCIIIGCLLKIPTYSLSYVYLSSLLLFAQKPNYEN